MAATSPARWLDGPVIWRMSGKKCKGNMTRTNPDRRATAQRRYIAAEDYLETLAHHGIDYLFVNPGTDFAPIVEAFSRAARSNRPVPQPMVVPHENAAVGMAHGVTMVTGRPQAVMVHTNVGTANAINMLIDAARDRIPDAAHLGPHAADREPARPARATPTSTGRRRCSTRPACCARS